MPNKIDSNLTALYIALESSLGTLPGTPVWRQAEPNSYSDFGGDSPKVARSPINPSRQRQKGSTVDLNAAGGFNHDFQQTALNRAIQSFFFAAWREKADTQNLQDTVVPVTSTTTTTFVAASGLGSFLPKHLVLASGFSTAANNGVFLLSAASATTLTTTGLTAEASPPAAARVQAVGVRFASADANISYVAGVCKLTTTAFDLTTLSLAVGEWVALGDDTAGNRFANNTGYARIKEIAATYLTFDLTSWTPVTETGTGKTISLYFGKFIKNESTASLIVTKSVQIERQLGNDGVGVQSEYLIGAVGNEVTFNLPQADKMTVDMSFVALRTEERSGTTGIKAGTRVAAVNEDAINTSLDIYSQKLYLLDTTTSIPTGLFGYVQNASMRISNGVTGLKALGRLGSFDISAGDFVAGGSINAYFTSIAAVAAVRNNTSAGWYGIVAKSNAGAVFDLAHLTLAGGRVTVAKDQPVEIPVEMEAVESDTLGHTASYTTFPFLPTTLMPVA